MSEEPRNFGRVAFSCRSANGPDPVFFRCWTHLLLRGMRSGDTCIAPAVELTHHWGAETICRQFVEEATGADSLLLLDDDMTFTTAELDRIRDNEANWDFDIVQGLCVSRKPPHAAIILLRGEGGGYQPARPNENSGTVEVAMVGLAFTIIRRQILEKIIAERGPKRLMFFFDELGRGEDCNFCELALEQGARIGVDTTCNIGHRFPVEVSHDMKTGSAKYAAHHQRGFKRKLKAMSDEPNSGERKPQPVTGGRHKK